MKKDIVFLCFPRILLMFQLIFENEITSPNNSMNFDANAANARSKFYDTSKSNSSKETRHLVKRLYNSIHHLRVHEMIC